MQFDVFYYQIISVGILGLSAHFFGKISRRLHIGEVVGQVIGGLVAGPLILFFFEHRIPAYREAIQSLHFLTFIFLSIIAFGIGDELNIQKLKKIGNESVIICIIQAIVTFIIVTVTFLFLGFSPLISLIIGSIGIATAPASTFIIMNKLEITGKLRNLLGSIVVIDDVIEIIFFSLFAQIALLVKNNGRLSVSTLFFPISRDLFIALAIGVFIFLVLRLLVERRWLQSKEESEKSPAIHGPEFLSRLISEMPGPSVEVFVIVSGCVALGIGLALHWHVPFLLTAVFAGFLISNLYSTQVFESLRIENATSMYSLGFFALIGANADIELFHPENLPFVLFYIAARFTGKFFGTWIGCRITKQEKRIRQSLPKLMLPQAGVAAIEAFFIATVLGESGEAILSIILPGLIFFEIVGILLSERTLLKWRSWITGGGELIDQTDIIKNKLKKEQVNIYSLLHPECLRIPLEVHSKGEAIWELIKTLQLNGYIKNAGEVLEIILQRERQGGTTIGDGIAILHGRIPRLPQPAIALGVLPNHGVVFGGIGDAPIDIVYLVLTPLENPELHLQILAAIAKLLSNKKARVSLRESQDALQAISVIKEYSPSS
ncbi:PTS sugar transporter subunit IIA [Chlamydiota bacterium]